MATLNYQVAASADDAGEESGGACDITTDPLANVDGTELNQVLSGRMRPFRVLPYRNMQEIPTHLNG